MHISITLVSLSKIYEMHISIERLGNIGSVMTKKAQATIDLGIRLSPQWKVAEDLGYRVSKLIDGDVGPLPLLPGYDQRVCARTVNVQVRGMDEKVRKRIF